MLGGSNLQAKLVTVKENFRRIGEFSETPSQFKPLDEEWKARMSNKDVAFWCDVSRYSVVQTYTAYHEGWGRLHGVNVTHVKELCYPESYELGSGLGLAKAITTSSNLKDRAQMREDRAQGINVDPQDPRYVRETRMSNDIDLCTWFIETADNEGWPKLDKARVDKASTTEFREGLRYGRRPIDGVKTFGSTMLHELTHTNQGGLLRDANVRDRADIPSCYGWACAVLLQDEKNADSIALLGITLKVWSFGYYVDREGNILPRP
ncbi:hypothetical protein HYQ46_000603 [Verticillium longisporum]|nr:hypothetical protein HYQ44_006132 [Verticillium longisporum]KAG7150455.1 hypothetical protein HYQ46_000603 [Verticillium longisporum]